MVASLDDVAVLEHHDRLTVLNGRKTVRDNEYGTVLHQGIHTSLYDGLGTGIDRRGRLIEDHDRRIGNGRTRDRDQLALALGKFCSVTGQNGIVALRELADIVEVMEFQLSSFKS